MSYETANRRVAAVGEIMAAMARVATAAHSYCEVLVDEGCSPEQATAETLTLMAQLQAAAVGHDAP